MEDEEGGEDNMKQMILVMILMLIAFLVINHQNKKIATNYNELQTACCFLAGWIISLIVMIIRFA